ncbi:hypothetical protein JCGZ_22433 [Jatropha curcas]|uniref:Uncharacterized protein n=1 Tax=Jatropha curcas TaxID=180498 RepID=A0A067JQP8_JATCU|nr:hypothetical protein JCGZ_22433 [Jatropha curcas]
MGRGYYGCVKSGLGEIMRSTVRSSGACLRRYVRASRRLARILHSRESVRYLHETSAVRLEVMEQDLSDTQADQHLLYRHLNYCTTHKRVVSSQARSKAKPKINELALYMDAAEGEKKRKVHGIGSQASQFYCSSASNAPAASSQPQPNHSTEEISALWARADAQRENLQSLERM